MKKIIISILCLGLVALPKLRAQEEKNYLPEAGDFAISVSAMPIFSFIGNMFNGSTNNALNKFGGEAYLSDNTFGNINPLVSITAKYLISNKFGVRINAGWLYTNVTDNQFVQDDAALIQNPFSQQKVVDSRNTKNNGVSVMAGVEYRVGKKRVQGVFGGGLVYAAQVGSVSYSYGNAMTPDNQSPSTAYTYGNTPPGFTSARIKNTLNAGCRHYFGAVCFAGVEWFFTPKISFGGEVNIAAVYRWGGAVNTTVEGYNTLTMQVEEWTDLTSPSSHGFSFGTGNIGGNINLTFYF